MRKIIVLFLITLPLLVSCSKTDSTASKFVGTWANSVETQKWEFLSGGACRFYAITVSGTSTKDVKTSWSTATNGTWKYDEESSMLITSIGDNVWQILDVSSNSWTGMKGGKAYNFHRYTDTNERHKVR